MAKPCASPPTWQGSIFTPNFEETEGSPSRTLLFKETLRKELAGTHSIWFHACLLKSGSFEVTRASSAEGANLPTELNTTISVRTKDNLAAEEIIANELREGTRVVRLVVNSYITIFSVDASLSGKTSQEIVNYVAKSLYDIGNRKNYYRTPVELRNVQVCARKGKTYFAMTTNSPVVTDRLRAVLQVFVNDPTEQQRLRSLIATNSKNLPRANCIMKGVTRDTPMALIHAIIKPYGSLINGSLRYSADNTSCSICVFDNCKPLPSQLEKVILREESNIPMLCKTDNILLSGIPTKACSVPTPTPTDQVLVPTVLSCSTSSLMLSESTAADAEEPITAATMPVVQQESLSTLSITATSKAWSVEPLASSVASETQPIPPGAPFDASPSVIQQPSTSVASSGNAACPSLGEPGWPWPDWYRPDCKYIFLQDLPYYDESNEEEEDFFVSSLRKALDTNVTTKPFSFEITFYHNPDGFAILEVELREHFDQILASNLRVFNLPLSISPWNGCGYNPKAKVPYRHVHLHFVSNEIKSSRRDSADKKRKAKKRAKKRGGLQEMPAHASLTS